MLNKNTKGFVLEDVKESLEWLKKSLTISFSNVEIQTAETIAEAKEVLGDFQPDIALIDLNLPDGSGLEIIKYIKGVYPSCYIVVTTIFDDENHIFPSLKAGASGYIHKEQPREQLAEMLKGIVEGRPPLSPAIARKVLQFFQPLAIDEAPLTSREEEVLMLIAKGYSTKKTAQMLMLSPYTVSGYIKDIYTKLNISSRVEATMEAAQRGLLEM